MNGGFVHPALLWGLALAALPVIIHLINRRRARLVRFAAVHFVRLTNRRLARRLKLKQFLLLLLRTLLLLALPLLLSRPYTVPPTVSATAAGTDQPTTRAILIDRSLSMRAKEEGETLFDRAKAKATDLVQSAGEQDGFVLVPAPFSDDVEAIGPTFSRRDVLDAIEALEPSYLATDFTAALDKTRALLDGATLSERRVYLIGDFTRTGYDADFSLNVGEKPVPVAAIDVREGRPLPNAALIDVKLVRSFFTGPRDWKATATAANWSAEPVDALPLSLVVGGKEAASGFVAIDANATATKDFILRLDEAGTTPLEARLPDDALGGDNAAVTLVNVTRDLRALVVNGRPSATRYKDEVFYLKEALNPGGMGRSQIFPTVITPDLLPQTPLDGIDLVFLAHVPTIAPETADKLRGFVANGGGLFISMGEHVDVDAYNERLPDLLPGWLRGERTAGDATENRAADVVHLSRLDYAHPAFAVFGDETAKSLYDAPVRRYMVFDPDPSRPKTILAAFTDQSPAIVELSAGKGRVLFFATAVSRTWSDLPIQPGFLPLVQELARHLVAGREGGEEIRLKVGQRWRAPDGETIRAVRRPDGKPAKLGKDKPDLTPPLSEPGLWRIQTTAGEQAAIVVLDPAESDLRPLSPEEREKAFAVSSLAAAGVGAELSDVRTEYTLYLAWLLLALIAGEVAVLRWMG
ncbi:MAG: VWA domain-containing protein [Myxococcales bacterium]|nr:MAG: VWA domain-containing protein [Myxococcales bacterium]